MLTGTMRLGFRTKMSLLLTSLLPQVPTIFTSYVISWRRLAEEYMMEADVLESGSSMQVATEWSSAAYGCEGAPPPEKQLGFTSAHLNNCFVYFWPVFDAALVPLSDGEIFLL